MPDREFRNVLCIRADNMGDVLMASPAIRALKESFGSRITLLTSKAGSLISPYLDCIDDTIVFNLPWVQSTGCESDALIALAADIKNRKFDAAIIFTVYSQSALPAATLAFMAGIPMRVAYARENPYQLLTNWVVDPEPYEQIRHQVERDLNLVAQLGALPANDHLRLQINAAEETSFLQKMESLGIDAGQPYLIFHPGVSDKKREYPTEYWVEAGRLVAEKYKIPILITGSEPEKTLAETIANGIAKSATSVGAISMAGIFSVGEFACLIDKALCVVSVNTGTIHIAAAMQTPVAVLYAQTNPQHTPWKSPHRILPYSVSKHLNSLNVIIKYVTDRLYAEDIPTPTPAHILLALDGLIG
ncbi:glycosyltransferase family 9 protein [Dyadobacter arcticus]|uniref:ADP-heptose:LPS heptosyltransferase n=1 Tax=Dyadobacter arcticus TaxID=1078754 RepID=A0ABX0UIH0_9BACT|nr:glycosyltransferase family 9 protein [Dyadobacter arcticus]NIJ52722.1 ADP-heptose:LPS heptosyltransferase [Dyadobacter arcticus]